MTYLCQCGETFDTLTAKRRHQSSGECPSLTDNIDTDGKSTDDIARETTEGLLTCTQCDHLNDGADFARSDDMTDAGYTIEVSFTCTECGFGNVNTAVLA